MDLDDQPNSGLWLIKIEGRSIVGEASFYIGRILIEIQELLSTDPW